MFTFEIFQLLFFPERGERMSSTEEITKSIKLPVTIDIALRNIKDAKVIIYYVINSV